LFAGLAGAFGQVAPGEPMPLTEVAAAAPTPVPTAPPGAPNLVRLQFPNSDVQDVLRLYEQLTGKQLIMDNFVQGKVSIFLSRDVPREEAIKIIEMNLLMNGFSLVPSEGDIVKVIGTGKNPRTTGVPVISDESEIPSGDHVISFLFKLRYADATELQQVLNQYLQPVQPYTSILALPKASSVLVTENSSVIRSLAHIVNQIDVPPAEVVSEFIKLDRADAQKVVDLLEKIFEKGQGSAQPGPGGGVRPIRQPVPQQVSVEGDLSSLTALSEEAVVVGKIKITADVRTNRIHVVTRPINMPFIRKLIGEFDANVEFAKPVTRPLKYVSAADMLPVIVQALTEPGTNQQGGAEAGAANPANQQQQQNRQNRQGSSSNQYSSGGMGSSGGGDSNLNISEELSTTAVDTTPKAVTIGNAKIIADQRANSIIMLGNREIVQKVQKILDEMDVRAPQVALSTVIGELTLSNDEEFGVDYFLRDHRGGGHAGGLASTTNFTGVPPFAGGSTTVPATGASPATTTGGSVFDPANLLGFTQLAQNAASGTNVYLAGANTLAAVVHVLHSTGRFKVISRPMVFTSNNKKAIIASGQEIPVPVSTLSSVVSTAGVTGANIGQQSSIQFKKVALQLEVVPLINSEKEVSLDILQKLDSLAGTTTVDGNAIPNIATRYIRTTVSAPNGATIVLGGLIVNSTDKNINGIPVLDRIPLLGYLFRSTTKKKDRTELIVLMRPEVALTNLDLYRLRAKNEQKTHFKADLNEEESITPEAGGKEEMPPPDLPPGKP
jgi:general secretion pathway protein D